MRKVIWLMHLSLDGFVSGPGGELDWAGAGMDDELWADVMDLLRTVDTAVFGRVTYQGFESYWPAVGSNPSSAKNELDFSRWIDQTPKAVASRSLRSLEWKNSALLGDKVAEGVLKLKREPGGNLLMFGSPGLAACLWKENLIDEVRMNMHPLVLGVGRPLFHDVAGRQQLKLVEARSFRSGVVGLRYNVG